MSEINRLISEARGYQFIYDNPEDQSYSPRIRSCRILAPDGKELTNRWDNHPTKWFGGGDIERSLPDYEHDLNEAWSLFLELPGVPEILKSRRREQVTVSWYGKLNTGESGWHSITIDGNDAQSLAMGICLSWLEWKGIPTTPAEPTPPAG